MSLPGYLRAGVVSIYGTGRSHGYVNNIRFPDSDFYFGVIDQFGSPSILHSVGQSVVYHKSSIVCRLRYSNWTYTLIDEENILFTET